MTTSKRLEAELGRAEAIAHFVAECEVVINQIDPELSYRKPDLEGFVRGCWPPNSEPADVASDFVSSLKTAEMARTITFKSTLAHKIGDEVAGVPIDSQ